LASVATSLGLPVSADLPDNVWKLLKLNPQPVRMLGSGGVEYLPVERRASGGSTMDAPGWTSVH
jgi:hypothetical protein